MPDEAERRRQHQAAHEALMRRYVRSDRPRVKVRIDPIIRTSLLALALGVALILASIALAPPA